MVMKQTININFSQGLDTKTDPKQVIYSKFLTMQNSVFTTGGLLSKRNGYGSLTSLPDNTSTDLNTFNSDLTAIGNKLEAFTSTAEQWYNRGNIQPVQLDVMPLVRNNTNQSQMDTAVSPTGFICTVYIDQDPTNLSDLITKYVIEDAMTGQVVISPTQITSADATYASGRVFLLGNYFIILFTVEISSTFHLEYIAINTSNPSMVGSPVSLTASYTPSTTVNFDAAVFNNKLYIAWNGASSSGIKVVSLSSTLALSSTVNPDASHVATLMSVTADESNQVIWISYYDLNSTTGYAFALSPSLVVVLVATEIISSGTVLNITSTALSGVLSFFYEVSNVYSYDSGIATNYIEQNTLTQSGTLGSASTLLRSVGLASKAFLINSQSYVLAVYDSLYQPTYFLADTTGNLIAKLAYENAGGYLTLGLPSATVNGTSVQIGYLFKDLIQAVNKNTNVPAGSQVNGIYSQTGINFASFTLTTESVQTAEIGSNLNITGGFLWGYDGYFPVENGFFLYPDSVEGTTATTGGSLIAQIYFYQFTYEWTDNQGNAFRSAPSIPIEVDASSSNTSTNLNTLNVPTLRLTYKVNPGIKLVGYRWSTAQQEYYQFTSIALPILNDMTTDSIAITDASDDATILGNNLIYTTGGVVENIGGPAFDSVFLFDDRLWGITSEDKNLVWYSKQVIESTPVEMSDLFTIYVAPSIGAQGSTGPLKCGASMDSNLILFKASAINYINGTGPDNTGANSQYSQPTFITSTVGCSNQKSIVFQPQGLMFEFASEAGNQIWLLGRDLSTQYIGAPVQALTANATVQSSVNITGTNQVRFTMSSGITIVYDYYYGQWDTFTNVPAISSTLYQGLHTYVNSFGQVFQETPNVYLDGSNPVLMSFTTAWIQLAGLQGYQRAYFFYILAEYFSPHLLNVQIAYDYNPAPTQQSIISPLNFNPTYGQDLNFGSGTPYGGATNREPWRIFFRQQRCESFQITVSEIYDPSYGFPAGSGLTISGLNIVVGVKKGYRPIRADSSVG